MDIKLIVMLILASNFASLIIAGITVYELPLIHNEGRKKKIIGIPSAIVAVAGLFLLSVWLVFGSNPISALRNCFTLNCSYQDIARLSSSGIICLLLTFVVSATVYIRIRRRQDQMASFNRKPIVLFLSILVFIPAINGYTASAEGEKKLSISEVCRRMTVTSDSFLYGTVDDEKAGYIVIRNGGELANEVQALFLSDDLKDLKYLTISSIQIKPGEAYTLILADNKGMKIKQNGGSVLYLSNENGEILDSVEVPGLKRNERYRKTADGWKVERLVEDAEETPEVPGPVFSAEGGFYSDAIDLTLSAPDGCVIYYTLDGSNPGEQSEKYTGPIHVYDRGSEPNVYRAIENVRTEYKTTFKVPETVDKAFVVRWKCSEKHWKAGEKNNETTVKECEDL